MRFTYMNKQTTTTNICFEVGDLQSGITLQPMRRPRFWNRYKDIVDYVNKTITYIETHITN